MISGSATNPKLTEQGFANIFRVVGRDDLQGWIARDLLAERWGNKPIATLHDGQACGKSLAEETSKRLNERGMAEAMFEAIEPGKPDYWDVVQKLRAMGVYSVTCCNQRAWDQAMTVALVKEQRKRRQVTQDN